MRVCGVFRCARFFIHPVKLSTAVTRCRETMSAKPENSPVEKLSGFDFFTFNRAIGRVETRENITSDAGALLVREVIHRLGIDKMLDKLDDPRAAARVRYTLPELVLFRVAMLAQGYSAQDDADKLAHDPAFRIAAWDRSGDRCLAERLASQPTMSRLIDILSADENLAVFADIAAAPVLERLEMEIGNGAGKRATIDIDGFPLSVFGKQEKSAYNGHHRQVEYYPFVAGFSLGGDYNTGASDGFVGAKLRAGNASGAAGAVEFIDECLERVATRFPEMDVDFRFDAAFINAEVVNHLDEKKVSFVGRLKCNEVLRRMAGNLVRRKPGPRPDYAREYVYDIGEYGASTWSKKQRVVLVVVDEPPVDGELDFGPRYFFIATNHSRESMPARAVLAHYRNRGTFEGRIGEFNNAMDLKLSHSEFPKNEALLRFGVFAFNLVSVLRAELEFEMVCLDIVRVQKRLLKAGAWIVKRGRRLVLKIAKTASGWWGLAMERLKKFMVESPRRLRRRIWRPVPVHAHASTPHPLME